MQDRGTHVTISSGTVVTTILILILTFLVWYLRDIVLDVLTAIVIASAMEPAIRFFVRHGLGRLLSVVLMYLIVASAFFSVLFFFIPPILNDAANFLQQLPTTVSQLNISDVTHGLLPWGQVSQTFNSANLLQNISTTITDSTGGIFTTVSAFFGGLVSFVLIVVFSFYFSVQETGVDDFLRIVAPVKHQAYVLNLWKRSQIKIGKWMQGQLVLALIVGALLYPGLVILQVPHALLLAVLAGVFELIPVFGQLMAAIPAVAVAAAAGGLTEALLVAGLYTVVQQFEAHLIYPNVVKKIVGVPPLLVILALLIGFQLVGFLGVLLSVPIAGALQEFLGDIDRDKTRALARLGLTPEGDAK
jgi:predicted PurR-regulated permease PerM